MLLTELPSAVTFHLPVPRISAEYHLADGHFQKNEFSDNSIGVNSFSTFYYAEHNIENL
jgi:hypothetical protein